ncbi:MAG: NAD(P) transhydrogenase subunit alpha [Bacteroidota bacterium]
MLIGLLSNKTDRRAAMVPATVAKLIKAEHELWFEAGLGARAYFDDKDYQAAGAAAKPRAEILKGANLIVCIEPPSEAEIKTIPAETYLIGMFNPLVDTALAERLSAQGLKAFSLDRIPRTTIAQSMDVLSSMASLAGYRAVLAGANALPSYFPMLMTAAGTIPPAKVLILGAGVAGLQAIATARRLGAQVEAFDVRAAAKEEVLSLGAKFVEVAGSTDDTSAGGYAVEQTEAYQQRQKELIHEHAAKADVIITTANIPGRKAPLLVEERTVMAMKPGSVIVDLAAVTGGNCALTEDGKTVVANGVSIIGNSHLAAEMSSDASRLYSNNVFNFFSHVFREAEINPEDEITAGTLIQ